MNTKKAEEELQNNREWKENNCESFSILFSIYRIATNICRLFYFTDTETELDNSKYIFFYQHEQQRKEFIFCLNDHMQTTNLRCAGIMSIRHSDEWKITTTKNILEKSCVWDPSSLSVYQFCKLDSFDCRSHMCVRMCRWLNTKLLIWD